MTDALDVAQRVLVVEDEALIAMMIEDLLLRLGYHVEVASTALDALHCIEHGPAFGLGMIDLQLPDWSGVGVIDALWRRWPGTPVIVVTGYNEFPADAPLPVLAGPLTFLAKPWKPEGLAAAARRVGLDLPATAGLDD